jgi:hypothetical protein
MDGGSNDGVCTIGTGRRRGREECLGWPESRGGEETVKKGGRVLDGLPVGAERRKEKMGVDSVARGKGGRGGSGRLATARERRTLAAVGGVAHE